MSNPWEDAYDHATGKGFGQDLERHGIEPAIQTLRQRLGFLCLSDEEIALEVAEGLDAAGLDPALAAKVPALQPADLALVA